MSEWFPAPGGDEQSSRRYQAEDERRKSRKRRLRLVQAGVALISVTLVALVGVFVVVPFLQDLRPEKTEVINDYPGPGEGEATIKVMSGDGLSTIGKALKDAGVVATVTAFTNAAANNPQSQSIGPGEYTLKLKMSGEQALDAMLDPDNRHVVTVTIPEGFRAAQTFTRLAKAMGIEKSEVEAAAANTEAIGLPPEAEGDVEGWLFPQQYTYDPGTSVTEALAQMVSRTEEVLTDLGVDRTKWRKTIILASVVEKESKLPEDRPKVARVFLNRVKADMPWQSDATLAYGVKEFDSVFSSDEAMSDDNPYNTYLHDGYPGGAICNPGEEAIRAAVSPAKTKALYFTVINPETGETAYAKDEAGHNANVAKLREWCALPEHADYNC